ncbi:uncharacterized protein LOC144167246 isoform X2 [Haemaphysalis longicornis]
MSASINPDIQSGRSSDRCLRRSSQSPRHSLLVTTRVVQYSPNALFSARGCVMQGSSGGAPFLLRTRLFWLLTYLCSAFSFVTADGNEPDLYYKLSKSCNGSELPGQPYLFHLAMVDKDEIPLEMKAAFFDDVCQPPGPAGGSSVYLSQYEVFQIAFVGTEGYYTQLEIGPYGHYLVILGSVSGSFLKYFLWVDVPNKQMDLTVSYAANVDRYRSLWRASLKIPVSYLPPGLKSMNAWAQHGRPSERRVLALYPPPAGSPCKVDSTTVKTFGEIDVKRICPNYDPKRLSHTWKRAFEEYYWASSTVAYPAVTLIAMCLLVQLQYRFLQGSN